MRIVASFTGRGIDVHDNLDAQSSETYSLLMNLRDGVATGRVRGFIVDGASADVIGDVREALESGELSLDTLVPPLPTRRERYRRRMNERTPEQRSAFLDAQERDLL